uniref:Reverse transcriptase domain-containing protein n=1 Tax=Dendroctonus ponderosae TaxID=77166 RepID=A0AAR5P0Z5_DENPD
MLVLGHLIKLENLNQKSEIIRRVKLTWAALEKVKYVLKNPDIPVHLKRKIDDMCIFPVATYGLETMIIAKGSADRLRTIQRTIQRAMFGVSIRDQIRNEEIRRRTKMTDLIRYMAEVKWIWAGRQYMDQQSDPELQGEVEEYRKSNGWMISRGSPVESRCNWLKIDRNGKHSERLMSRSGPDKADIEEEETLTSQ